MAKIKGQLEGAQAENLASDPTNLPDGLLWLNTATKLVKTVINSAKVQLAHYSIVTNTAAIANTQVAAADVTGLLLSSASARSAIIDYQIRRLSDSVEAVERGVLFATFNTLANTWTLTPAGAGGDESGVTLSITAAGQVQYTSDTMAGSYNTGGSLMTFAARTFA